MSRKRTREQNEQAIDRGNAAKGALLDETVVAAFRMVEGDAIVRLRQSVTPEDAFRASLTLQVTEAVLGTLKAYVAEGESAARDLAGTIERDRLAREAERDHANYLTAARAARSEFDHSMTATRGDESNV